MRRVEAFHAGRRMRHSAATRVVQGSCCCKPQAPSKSRRPRALRTVSPTHENGFEGTWQFFEPISCRIKIRRSFSGRKCDLKSRFCFSEMPEYPVSTLPHFLARSTASEPHPGAQIACIHYNIYDPRLFIHVLPCKSTILFDYHSDLPAALSSLSHTLR